MVSELNKGLSLILHGVHGHIVSKLNATPQVALRLNVFHRHLLRIAKDSNIVTNLVSKLPSSQVCNNESEGVTGQQENKGNPQLPFTEILRSQ
jgi:hypothetical protein